MQRKATLAGMVANTGLDRFKNRISKVLQWSPFTGALRTRCSWYWGQE